MAVTYVHVVRAGPLILFCAIHGHLIRPPVSRKTSQVHVSQTFVELCAGLALLD